MTKPAREIYRARLDVVSREIMSGDMAAAAAGMDYPQVQQTTDGAVELMDASPTEEAASEYRRFQLGMGATNYHRICDRAEFEAGGREIAGQHTSFIMRCGTFVIPAHCNTMCLRLDGDRRLGAGISADIQYRDRAIFTPRQLRRPREARP